MKTLIRNLIISTSLLGSALTLADEAPQKKCNGVKDDDFATYMEKDAKNYEFLANNTLVKDKRTGLTWQRCPLGSTLDDNGTANNTKDDKCKGSVWPRAVAEGGTPPSCTSGGAAAYCVGKLFKTWSDAQTAVKAVGDGWRMPNVKELASIAIPNCFVKKNNYVFPGGMTHPQFSFISSTPAIKDGKYTHFKLVSFFQLDLFMDVKADTINNAMAPNGQGVMLVKD